MSATGIHVIIPTHTARRLPLVLVGLSRQTRRADTIIVSCDVDDDAIGETINHWSGRLGLRIHWVRRGHAGVERLCQVRNNAVRYLADELGVSTGRLVVLDGDMLAADDCLALHESIGRDADLVYPYRVDLSEQATSAIDPEQFSAGVQTLRPSPDEASVLRRRQRRSIRQLWMRRARLGPLHKPKLLGGHFSVSFEVYLRLNGFDELYQGWGFKDDEFARRAAILGAVCAVPVSRIIAFHLWHPRRQPGGRMRDNPNYQRFSRRDLPLAAQHGVRNPLAQAPVRADVFNPR